MARPGWYATTAVAAVLALGPSLVFWSGVGVLRRLAEVVRRAAGLARRADRRPRDGRKPTPTPRPAPAPTPGQVAVLIAAHNEELVIDHTLASVPSEIPRDQVFVISDGSTDRTAERARAQGCNVLELNPNRGKAGALAEGVARFGLVDRFEVVLLLDADSRLSRDYLATGLPLFADPAVVAVAGRAKTLWHPQTLSWTGRLLVAHRERLYVIFQALVKYGQAARWANSVSIAPGFASMYRTRALRDIDIAAPGLAIEDFNMTFEVHARKLGRVAFHPGAAVAYTQDPDAFGDYVRQVRRWALGFWQTARRHGVHAGRFWLALAFFVVEMVLSSLMFVTLGPALLLSCAALGAQELAGPQPGVLDTVAGLVPARAALVGVLLPDVVLTLAVAAIQRRREYLLVGLAFPIMRIIDAALCLQALWLSVRTMSAGTWSSPRRRQDEAAQDVCGQVVIDVTTAAIQTGTPAAAPAATPAVTPAVTPAAAVAVTKDATQLRGADVVVLPDHEPQTRTAEPRRAVS